MSDIEVSNGRKPRARFDLDLSEWIVIISGILIGWISYLKYA